MPTFKAERRRGRGLNVEIGRGAAGEKRFFHLLRKGKVARRFAHQEGKFAEGEKETMPIPRGGGCLLLGNLLGRGGRRRNSRKGGLTSKRGGGCMGRFFFLFEISLRDQVEPFLWGKEGGSKESFLCP